jgi:hypothetical protein
MSAECAADHTTTLQMLSNLEAGRLEGVPCAAGSQATMGAVARAGGAAAATILTLDAAVSSPPPSGTVRYSLHNTTLWSSTTGWESAQEAIRLAAQTAAAQEVVIDIREEDAAESQPSSAEAACRTDNMPLLQGSQDVGASRSDAGQSSFHLAALVVVLLLAIGVPCLLP